jgi:hypothetical protein
MTNPFFDHRSRTGTAKFLRKIYSQCPFLGDNGVRSTTNIIISCYPEVTEHRYQAI